MYIQKRKKETTYGRLYCHKYIKLLLWTVKTVYAAPFLRKELLK